jgi:hypothetical protein
MSQAHIDLLQGVLVAACEHLTAVGVCEFAAEDAWDSRCKSGDCTYCDLDRAVDALPAEMKP